MKEQMMKMMAKTALKTAEVSAGKLCAFMLHQPKVPQKLIQAKRTEK